MSISLTVRSSRWPANAGPRHLPILLLGYIGLRWGEVTAPAFCDVDFNHRCGDIRNAFFDVGGHVILGPKLFWFRSLLVWISRFRRLLKVLFAFLLLSLEAMHLVHKFG